MAGKYKYEKPAGGEGYNDESLADSSAKFKAIFEAASDAIFILDKSTFADCNHSAEVLLRVSREQIVGRNVTDFSPSSQPDGTSSAQKAAGIIAKVEEGIPQFFEWQLCVLDGSVRDTEISTNKIDIKGRKLQLSIVRDVTERNLERQALRSSEKMFRELFENSLTGIFITRPDGTILEANPEACRLMGRTEADLRQIGRDQVVNMADPRLPAALEERTRTGQFRGELTLIRSDNTIFPVLLASRIFSDSAGQVKSNDFFLDITRRKRFEEALRESEETMRAVLNATDESIMLLTPGGILIDLNETAAQRLGRSRESLIGQNMRDILPPSVTEQRLVFVNTVVSTGRHLIFEDERDGRWLVNHLHPILDKNGKVSRIAVYSQDITEHKQADMQLMKLNETLEERVAERTRQLEAINKKLSFHIQEIEQFTYIASHDLQEPLRSMVNFSQLLEDNYVGKPGDEGPRYLAFIRDSAVRMRGLVKGLLDYSLLGKQSVSSLVECNSLVSEVIHELADITRAADARITVKKLPVIHGYASELKLLFHNLLANAIKFRKSGVAPEIIISAETRADGVIFAVRDNGIGITEKDRDKIFTIFRRMHNRGEYGGIGVGLALCKKIVDLHGGRIWVESSPGSGSSFIFTIPK